jgi:hypothetical protein
MSNEISIIIRHAEPGPMDELPFGTACKVVLGDKYDLYVQASKNECEKPNWLFIGTFTDDSLIQEEIDFILGNK